MMDMRSPRIARCCSGIDFFKWKFEMNNNKRYFGIYYFGCRKPQVIQAENLGWAQTIAQEMSKTLRPDRVLQKVTRFRGNPSRYPVLPTKTIIYALAMASLGKR